MPQKRLAVLLSEILHLERECEECRATTTMPFVELKTGSPPPLADQILDQCPWCNHRIEKPLRAKIKALLSFDLLFRMEIGKTRLK